MLRGLDLYPDDLGHAREAYSEMAKRYSSGLSALWARNVLLLLGEQADAVAECRKLSRQQPALSSPFGEQYVRSFDYRIGKFKHEEFLAISATLRYEQASSEFLVGLTRLAEGDKNGAREHFEKVAAMRLLDCDFSHMSRCFLARMDKDEKWPRWISEKKIEPKPKRE